MSKKHVFLQFFSKIALFACVFCAFFIPSAFANLPAGYTELEYIDVPATAYINLGMYPAAHGKLRVKFSPIELGSNYLCGYRDSNFLYSGIMGSVTGNTINSTMVRDASDVSVTGSIVRKANNVYDIQANAKYVEGAGYTTELTVNNLTTGEIETVVGERFVANPISINQNMLLFAVNATNRLPKARGYLYMYWNDDGELVRHLVPAKRNSDGEIGMYDTVSGTFFENAGTGDFIAGPIANCKTFGTDGVTCTECETDYILNNDGGCSGQIKIATTKYVDDEFAPLNTALVNAISVVDNVVTQTIAQAAAIGELQNTKQTRPSDDNECPAGKKCLLVTDESGTPHWYPIVESILPDAYTQLEYIESTGTQYIDTGILPSEVDNIYIKFKNTDSDRGYLIGAAGGGKYNYIGIHNAFNGYGENWGGASNYMPFITPADTAVHTIEADLISVPKFYLDGELKATQTVYSTISSQYTLKINDAVYGSTNRCSAQYYSVTLSKNNAQIRNLIPAKRNSDSAIGMYDTVSGTFFTNSGTGSFVAGPTVF